GDSTTQEIYEILKKIVEMLITANVNLISVGADGAITEYNAQILLMQGSETEEFLTYNNEIYNIHFQAPIYSGKPIIRIQDPKYTKKNRRNAIHNGACLLVLGNHTIQYIQIYQLAQKENSAFYIRDVVNVDKQNDGAAYSVFVQNFWLNVKIIDV
ncbi:15251_t:CDS:1, partial [Funneliformis geosporum]